MRVTYCDTCGCPIKTNKFRLITAKYEENINCNLDSEAENFYNSKKGFIKEKEVSIFFTRGRSKSGRNIIFCSISSKMYYINRSPFV